MILIETLILRVDWFGDEVIVEVSNHTEKFGLSNLLNILH